MVESAQLPPGTVRMAPEDLAAFAGAVLEASGISPEHSALAADVLIAADMRGIRSHGIARLPYFAVRLERGVINAQPDLQLERRTNTTAALDADNGLGMVACRLAVHTAIEMAESHGSGFVTVNRSNHFGFAGYWAKMAMERGYIGIALANSGRRVAPTFSTEAMLGTNPMAIGIPGGDGTDFLLDMATSAVAVGKVETALREERVVPAGWVSGEPTLDERGVLRYESPLLPLGGQGDETGGHKGYGLSLMVELLCGALAGSALPARIAGASGEQPASMGQFIGVLRPDGFRSPDAVHGDMATTFRTLRSAATEPERDRVLIHGEPERAAEVENRDLGLPVTPELMKQLKKLDAELHIRYPW